MRVNLAALVIGLAACLAFAIPARSARSEASLPGNPSDEGTASTVPGAKLPTFRVKATVNTDVRSLFALLMDVGYTPAWAYGISEARRIEHLGPRADLLYLYSNTPWPVRDRDMVVERASEAAVDEQSFRITWKCVRGKLAERKHVVRIALCESVFLLRGIDDSHSALEYSVSIDPAGSLPLWARDWFVRKAPGETLAAILRRAEAAQAKKKPNPR